MNTSLPLCGLRSLWFALQCTLCLLPLGLSAHVVDTGHATVSLSGNQVYMVISIPIAALSGADANNDGVQTPGQTQARQAALIAQVQKGLTLEGDGHQAAWTQVTLAPESPTHLSVVAAAAWDAAPAVVTLDYRLWRLTPLESPGAVAETLKVRLVRVVDGKTQAEEVGLLSPHHPRMEFFAPVHRHVANFAHHGFDHIMGGADHIVFLIALLASGISMGRWAALLTAFTVAHGVTFGLASLGWVNADAAVVEPAIAATIVLVSALHLLRVQVRLRWELLLVFALGLVHGLGFASAMREGGADQLIALSPYPVWSIVGFNLGIEIGQSAVALALYTLVRVLRRIFPGGDDTPWQRAAGLTSFALGMYWLAQRIPS